MLEGQAQLVGSCGKAQLAQDPRDPGCSRLEKIPEEKDLGPITLTHGAFQLPISRTQGVSTGPGSSAFQWWQSDGQDATRSRT